MDYVLFVGLVQRMIADIIILINLHGYHNIRDWEVVLVSRLIDRFVNFVVLVNLQDVL